MKLTILKTIRWYQKYLSSDNGLLKMIFPTALICRFVPSCSEYSYQAIRKYGIIFGGWKAFKRLTRCHPGNKGGADFLR